MERIKYITQKRSTLKTQITTLTKLTEQDDYDPLNVKMRLKRITELFHGYEELHDELAVIDPQNDRLDEFDEIQDRYYALASKIGTANNSNVTHNESLNQTSVQTEKPRRIKLPIPNIPKFDGTIEHWLSYKNTFMTMVDARDDISDLEKFIHLRDSLKGEALKKISLYDNSDTSYKAAWKVLTEAYEKTRVLISNHLDAILELSVKNKLLSQELTRLVDDTRQHVTMLNMLKVQPDEHLIIRIIEKALQQHIREKWEEKLNLNSYPTLEHLYTFLSETAFRLKTLETDAIRVKTESEKKRPNANKDSRVFKSRKIESTGVGAFITTSSANCFVCKIEKHELYRCPTFRTATLQRKWEIVNNAKLCKNCLRSHNGPCTSSHCKLCQRFHNTLLHNHNQKLANSATRGLTKPSGSATTKGETA